MTSEERERIRSFGHGLRPGVRIGLRAADDERGEALAAFCRELAELVPGLVVVEELPGEDGPDPAILVGDGLIYAALPLGLELEPFLEALHRLAGQAAPLEPAEQAVLADVGLPAELRVYVVRQCPHCPVTLKALLPLPFFNSAVKLTVIDAELFPEKAAADDIRSVPVVLLDGRFRWTGELKAAEVLAVMRDRDPATLTAESLAGMLADGRAGQVTDFMLERDVIFPAFVELLVHPKWPVRLGAMVVAEELAAANPPLALRLVAPLWERFEHLGTALQGDVVYLFGALGALEMLSELEKLAGGEAGAAEEVREAAKDALAALRCT